MIKSIIKTSIIKGILRKQMPISLDKKNQVSFLNAKPIVLDKVYCVVNFDDLCPIPEKSSHLGRGGGVNDFVTLKQQDLLRFFPFLGVTHFMVPQFIPSDYYYYYKKKHYLISNEENKEWIEYYNTLCKKYNVEISSHGLFHRQFENIFFARHTEFAYLDYMQSLKKITQSIHCFNKVGINPYGFRPPGWDMNSDLSLINAIKDSGLKYGCLSSYEGGLNSNIQRISYYHPTLLNGIVNFPDNINIDWPIDKIKLTIKNIVNQQGIVSIKGHFSKHSLPNSFSEENYLKLILVIQFIIAEYKQIEFATFKDVYLKIENKGLL